MINFRLKLTRLNQPLLDQFPGLALLDALFQNSRQVKIAKFAVSAAHDRLLLSIFNTRHILATLTGSPSDVTYDRAYIVPQADAARTDAIFTGIRPRFLQKLLEQKILVNSTQPKVQE